MIKAWRNLWRPKLREKPHYKNILTVGSMDDVPQAISRDIYLVCRGGTYRWIVLQCPCLCGRRIEVNLMRSRYPYWRLRRHGDSISLSPSLWMSEETCGSHFWLKRNRVVWAEFERLQNTVEKQQRDLRF